MANMSASILRSIVSSIFSVKAEKMILSGEISPDFNVNGGSSYSCCAGESWDTFKIWGWSPKNGLNPIEVDQSWSAGDGDRYEAPEQPLHEMVTGEEVFFIIHSSKNRGTWDGAETVETWNLYKAPNFHEKWRVIKLADLARWEAWVNE